MGNGGLGTAQLGTGVFINPYTFVPFPEGELDRGEPAGHESLGGSEGVPRYIGRIDYRLTAKSRVLIRGRTNGQESTPPSRAGTPVIPGSSLHGALRAMHETLVGGCLRVFDAAFRPSYRDVVVAGLNNGWDLAVVKDVDEQGRPTVLVRCSEYGRVSDRDLKHALGPGLLRTGTRLAVSGSPDRQKVFRHATISLESDGDWVLVLTDGRARQKPRKPPAHGDREYIPYKAVVGKVGGGSELGGVDDAAWGAFVDSAAESWDYTKALRGTNGPQMRLREIQRAKEAAERVSGTPHVITWPESAEGSEVEGAADLVSVGSTDQGNHRLIGTRPPHRPWLFPGQPIWVKVGKDKRVTAIKLSMAWRHVGGSDPAGSRVPPTMLPCSDPHDLCPSCRVFGSADPDPAKPDEQARQASYRGHVRVGDAHPEGDVDLEPLELAPMGRPRPGAGQFYLVTPAGTALPDDIPLREWGSAADQSKPRQLRGRKYYWRTGGRVTEPLWQAKEHHSTTMRSAADAFPAGTVFTGSIHFDGLTAAEVGSLLCALKPGLVLESPGELVFTVGGGRPFGFGACTADVRLSVAQTPAQRWRSAGGDELSAQAAVAAFKQSRPVAEPTWPALARACTFDAVEADRIWYPPGASWDQVGTRQFDEGYHFWRTSIGIHQDPPKPLVQLPDISSERQDLRIERPGGNR